MDKNENKKTFGAYIVRRRKELGMTQKAFAEKLYVTESAVSKWERGMSYPDITLIQTICDVLQISEHELLTGGEDTQKRRTEDLASRYLKITRNYRIGQYIFYGGIFLICAISNLAVSHRLDWVWIVAASELLAASLTLAPAVAALFPKFCRYKTGISMISFLGSLELLLAICCISTGGRWFPVAGSSVLFGLTLIFLPFLLSNLPFPEEVRRRKLSVYLLTETGLLLLVILTACLYSGSIWFPTIAVSVLFGLGFFVLPVLLRQLPLPERLQNHKTLLYFTVQTAFLFALIFTADLQNGGGFSFGISLPTAGMISLLPWGIAMFLRYLPVNIWMRGASCLGWTACWIWLCPWLMEKILTAYYGYGSDSPLSLFWITPDFSNWGDGMAVMNVFAILVGSLAGIGGILAGIALWRWRKQKIIDKQHGMGYSEGDQDD